MSLLKTPQEIELLKQGGAILSRALRAAADACVAGAKTEDLDRIARSVIEESGATSSFLGYRIRGEGTPYPGTLCISINDEVVHGLPTPNRVIKDGDIVSLDIGCWYQGLCTDMATTVIVGKTDARTQKLVEVTKEALIRGISIIRDGKMINDIGAVIEDYVKPFGFGIVRDLVGHGVGHAVHEDPQIPNYRDKYTPKVKMREGMVLAIEPMLVLGNPQVYIKDDEWTFATVDGKTCAHFELTVVVTKTGYELITPWP